MLLKCFIQHASKLGKLSSAHRTGKGQFSFQSQRRTMPKNVQTTRQLNSFHMLTRLYSKSFKLGSSSTWTENSRCASWASKKQRKPEIKSPIFVGSWQTREFQENTYFCFIDYAKLFDCVDHNKLENSPDHLTCLLSNLCEGQEATVRTGHEAMDWVKTGKGVHQGCILSPCLFNFYAGYVMQNAGLDES